MGFFSGIGKIFKKVGGAVGGIAKKAFPSVLSIAKGFIPGGNLIGSAYDLVKGKSGGGSDFEKQIHAEFAKKGQGGSAASGGSRVGRTSSGGTKRVVIFK